MGVVNTMLKSIGKTQGSFSDFNRGYERNAYFKGVQDGSEQLGGLGWGAFGIGGVAR